MKSLLRQLRESLGRLSPVTIFLIAVAYLLTLGMVDFFSPVGMSFTLLYLIGVVLAAWGAGQWPAIAASLVCLTAIAYVEYTVRHRDQGWVVLWNALSRLVIFLGASWFTARLTRLTRELEHLVDSRTAEWRAEAERHRETSARLTEVLERFEQVTNNITEVFWLTDLEQRRIVYVSPGYEKLWGRSPGELYRDSTAWLAGVHPEDRARVGGTYLEEQLAGRFDTEYRIMRPDGSVRWVRDRAFAVRDSSGRVYRMAGIAGDITERKRTEFLLQAQRDVSVGLSLTSDLRAALDSLLRVATRMEGLDCGGVYLLDGVSRCFELAASCGISDEFRSKVGLFGPETPQVALMLRGRPYYSTYPDASLELDRQKKAEGLRAVAFLPLCHEGAVLGCLNLASHQHDSIPESTRTVLEAIATQAAGAIARIRTEQALQQSEARLRSIIARVPIVLFAVDEQGTLTFEDGQALRALGIIPGARVGQSVAEVYRDSPEILDNFARVIKGEEFSSVVKVGPLLLDCWYSPVTGKDGAVKGFIGVATDITQRQLLERQILEISDREQARFGQDIHDGLCQQLVSLAFDANSLGSKLAGRKAPESAIARRIADLLDQAITEARHLSRGLFPVRLDLDGLQPALQELANTTRERFQLDCVLESSSTRLRVNTAASTHLYRIAQEAITNAIKHGRAKTIRIQLRAYDQQLELRVLDDGSGLMRKRTDRLAGMGMHIMDYRARSLGGSLRVSSHQGGGTLVCCCVPCRQD